MIHYLVDVSWFLYRGYHAMSHVYPEYPEIHFICKKLESLMYRNDSIVHLTLDGYDVKGKRLCENYKAGRHKENAYNVYSGLYSFIKLLNNNRIKIYFNKHYESDEIIYTLSRTLCGKKKILSGDKDLLQSLCEDVIIDNGKSLAITEQSYLYDYADKFFGIEPTKLPLFRAIVGDQSDKLKPPVSRFPHKLAAKLVNDIEYSGNIISVEQIKDVSKNYSESELKWINKLIESYDSFKLNYDIMKLNIINESITETYISKEVDFSDFLKSKILKLNSL